MSSIKSLKFNADNSRFVVGTADGFLVYDTDPFKYKYSRHCFEGGLNEVAIIGQSAAVLFVGTGINPNYGKNVALIWDDKREKAVFNIICNNDVKHITARAQLVAVSTLSMVHVFQLAPGPKKLPIHQIEPEACNCILLNNDDDNPMLIYPSINTGEIKIIRYKWLGEANVEKSTEIDNNRTLSESSIQTIKAHNNKIKCIAINREGNLLATTSVTGTLIRIYDLVTCTLIQELRRGMMTASIMDICFSPQSNYIAVVSNTGTVHVYSIAKGNKKLPENKKSSLYFVSRVLPSYFSSEWGFAEIALEPEWVKSGLILCFGSDNLSIVVIVKNGKYIKYVIDPINKKITKDKERNWYNPPN